MAESRRVLGSLIVLGMVLSTFAAAVSVVATSLPSKLIPNVSLAAPENWWNSSWQYRKPVTITNSGSTLTDYQMLFEIDTASLISTGKMRSDGGDMRFATSGGTELSYWIESGVNTSATKVWVKVPSISAGIATIYMYYGKSSAASAENGDTTFEFFDDFLTDTWTDSRGGWAATTFDGRTVLQSGAEPWNGSYTMNQQTHKYIGDVGGDWAVEMCTYWDSPSGSYGRYWFIVFTDQGGHTSASSGYSGHSSELYWGSTNEHRIQRVQYPDNWDRYWAIASGAPNKNTWARQTLKKFGGTISYTDAITVSKTDPSPLTTFACLDFHHNTEGSGAAGKLNVDWILVRKHASPEPTYLFGGEDNAENGNVPPTASFTYSPSSPTTSDTIQFTDTSTDPDGTIDNWWWYFSDGTSSYLQNPTYQWSSAGEYWVSLHVTDDDGADDMENKVIIVVGKASTTLTVAPSTFTLQPGNSTTLTAMLTSDGTPLAGKTLSWSATSGGVVPSSGTTDSLGQVTVTYAAPSHEDNVTVTVTFAGDNQYLSSSGSSSGKIESALPIQADVEIKPDTLQIGSEGEWVTCYIELPNNNAENIDVSSIWLEGRIQVDPAAPTEIGDYDNDGVPDLIVKFDRVSVENIVSPGLVTLTVTGNDLGGSTFIGSDKIDVIKTGSGALASFSFTVPGEAPEVKEEVYNPDLEITTEAGDNKVTVSVSSDVSTGTTLVVNVDNAVVPISSLDELVVLFDNENIELADDYDDVLDATDEDEPEYLVLVGAEGIQVLVSIPSFSTHTVTISTAAAPSETQPPEEVVTPPAEGIPIAALLAIAGLALTVFIAAVLIGHRHARGEATSELIEHGLSSMRLQEVDIFREIRDMGEFTVPELVHKTGASNILAWRAVQKLIEKGLVQPTGDVKPPAAGRGKPSTVYRYVGD